MELDGLGYAPSRGPAVDFRLQMHSHTRLRQMGEAGARRNTAGLCTTACREEAARNDGLIERILIKNAARLDTTQTSRRLLALTGLIAGCC
jgi:hypothetical protein